MRRRPSPVQQWVDSIPSYGNTSSSSFDQETSEAPESSSNLLPSDKTTTSCSLIRDKIQRPGNMTASTAIKTSNSPAITMTGPASSVPQNKLVRDLSLQSDSSHCSSVESLLELRKADPEAILLGLGFGCPNSPQSNGTLARIPKRFLQPSKLKGIAINDFLKQQQESSESLDTASLGFRGLTGSPHVAPSEIVQKIIERLREHENHELESQTNTTNSNEFGLAQQDGRLSVLSPDNRQYLERPRSKSPDMRNKRMIIGQKSFAFGYNGDLIEIKSFDTDDNNLDDESIEARVDPHPSEISELEKTVDTTLTIERPVYAAEKRLAKQQSFDEDRSGNSLLATYGDEASASPHREKVLEQRDSLAEADSSESNSATSSQRKSASQNILKDGILGSMSRRASDSLCDARLGSRNTATFTENRRLSDGTIKARLQSFERESEGAEKRRFSDRKPGLKRQANVRDVDLLNYESAMDQENSALRRSASPEKIPMEIISDDECKNEKIESEFGKLEEGAEGGRRLRYPENEECCCENDELDQICGHDEASVDCCCRTSSIPCWRKKAKKITIEGEKLEENKTAKKRQDMREMLSSVMSVRMEPGF